MLVVELGLTIPIPDQEYGMVRPNIRLEIDETGDVDTQVTQQLQTAERVFGKIEEQYEVILTNLLATHTGDASIGDRVSGLEQAFNKLTRKVRELVEASSD